MPSQLLASAVSTAAAVVHVVAMRTTPLACSGRAPVHPTRVHQRTHQRVHDVPLPIPVAGSFIDRLSWPQHEALLMLRNRSAAINITPENGTDPH